MAEDRSQERPPPIVIKRRIKPKEAPHGGAWKVAYADFVTAMMAFFLLLWLLNVTTDEQKAGISNLFQPESITVSESAGSGGGLAGLALDAVGALRSAGSPPSVSIPIPSRGGFEDERGLNEAATSSDTPNPDSDNVEARNREQESLQRAQAELRLAVRQNPELQSFQDSLLMETTPEGLRIQIVDQERIAMFQPGTAEMSGYSKALLDIITRVIVKFPNSLSITGHTASGAADSADVRSSWEISGARANTARRVMVAAGLPESRIENVTGRADIDHLIPDDPESSSNRRVSILLLRQAVPAGEPTGGETGKGG